MGQTSTKRGLPPRWGLQNEQGPHGPRRILWFGPNRIALDDIEVIQSGEDRERPVAGLLLGAAVFMTAALVLAFGVFESGWRERFLIGTGFLAFLGCAGLWETTKLRSQSFYEIKIHTHTNGVVTFASANVQEVEAFLSALAAAGVKRA